MIYRYFLRGQSTIKFNFDQKIEQNKQYYEQNEQLFELLKSCDNDHYSKVS